MDSLQSASPCCLLWDLGPDAANTPVLGPSRDHLVSDSSPAFPPSATSCDGLAHLELPELALPDFWRDMPLTSIPLAPVHAAHFSTPPPGYILQAAHYPMQQPSAFSAAPPTLNPPQGAPGMNCFLPAVQPDFEVAARLLTPSCSGFLSFQEVNLKRDLPRVPSSNSPDMASSGGISNPEDFTEIRENGGRVSRVNRGALAQKRFRERQKEKLRSSQRQLEELTEQVSKLMQQKSRLETRNRVLEQVVLLNTHHEERLHANKEIMVREQEMLLDELAQFMNLVEGRSDITLSMAKQWTVEQMVENIFPRYINKLKRLLAEVNQSPGEGSPSAVELTKLVTWRRQHEDRRALFSKYFWGLLSWNIAEMAKAGKPPGATVWNQILQGIGFTSAQEEKLLDARQHLLEELHLVATEWKEIVPVLALELLQMEKGKWHKSPSVQRLVENLAAEREAVLTFLYIVFDETLTPVQEAYLETQSYPWCPDIWELVNLLAKSKKEPQHADPLPALSLGMDALKPLMPFKTAFMFLTTPITAKGAGLRLKRAIILDPFMTVVPESAFPMPPLSVLQPMTVYDLHCGAYRETTLWEWLQANLPNYVQVLPQAREVATMGHLPWVTS